jgi:hypothetical protein
VPTNNKFKKHAHHMWAPNKVPSHVKFWASHDPEYDNNDDYYYINNNKG